jgi:serine/threonine protein kinase
MPRASPVRRRSSPRSSTRASSGTSPTAQTQTARPFSPWNGSKARTSPFSLGCVLFECLTGEPAFGGEHAAATLTKVLFEETPSARSLKPDVPEALDALVRRMLAKPELFRERPREPPPPRAGARMAGRGRLAIEAVALISGLLLGH